VLKDLLDPKVLQVPQGQYLMLQVLKVLLALLVPRVSLGLRVFKVRLVKEVLSALLVPTQTLLAHKGLQAQEVRLGLLDPLVQTRKFLAQRDPLVL
jgi:hypothetical protein